MFCGGKEWIDVLVEIVFSQEIRISGKKRKKEETTVTE